LLDDADGDSEVAAQLDALERASWSALHARAVFVANPQGA
jgi:alkyl hydroperoxide reductase subunit AhpC